MDYGLRYDYQTYLKEQYGRMPNTVLTLPNPVIGGPTGPRSSRATEAGAATASSLTIIRMRLVRALGVAYQIDPKTVFRGGLGVQYYHAPNNAFLSYNDTVFYSVSGPGIRPPVHDNLTSGNPYAPGNRFRLGLRWSISEL